MLFCNQMKSLSERKGKFALKLNNRTVEYADDQILIQKSESYEKLKNEKFSKIKRIDYFKIHSNYAKFKGEI